MNKWVRRNRGQLSTCQGCGKDILRGSKHDYNEESGTRYHLTCDLVSLATVPRESWVGMHVLHPMEQRGDTPIWVGENGQPDFDQGVVFAVRESTTGLQDVSFYPDGTEKNWSLHYYADNLWVRV